MGCGSSVASCPVKDGEPVVPVGSETPLPPSKGTAKLSAFNKDNTNEVSTPVVPMPKASVTKIFNTNRTMLLYDDICIEDREVVWNLMKGRKLLSHDPPEGEINTSTCATISDPVSQLPQIAVHTDFGTVMVPLTQQEARLLPEQSNQSAPVTQTEEGEQLDLGPLTGASLLHKRSRYCKVSGYRVRHLIGHGRAVRAVGISPDFRMLVTGDGTEGRQTLLRCVNPSTGQRIGSLSSRGGTSEAPCDVHFSANGQILATCDQSDTVLLWDVTTFRCKKTIHVEGPEGSEYFIVGVRLSPDGKLLIAAAEQSNDEGMNRGRVVVWDLGQRKQRVIFKEHASTVLSVAVSPDSELVISGGRDGLLFLWSANTGEILHSLVGHPSGIRGCNFSSCGEMMISVDAKVVILWSTATGSCFFSQHIDGTHMAGEVAPTLPSPRAEKANKLRFTAAQFTPGGLILIASSNRIIKLLTPHDMVECFSFTSRAPISCVSCGTTAVALGDIFGNVYLLDLFLKGCDNPPEMPEEPYWEEEEEEEEEDEGLKELGLPPQSGTSNNEGGGTDDAK
eukprot:TRINITY_DN20957_c0_g1_i1.p1 TRINITY_DN20957_c0_g1~~TRINITY_DN20957_c0_g1_i1.p1  ORF type:complete len:563 (+),score=82.18 TRINITY_DN20957_c0_g1_i1:76-1764(+)